MKDEEKKIPVSISASNPSLEDIISDSLKNDGSKIGRNDKVL